MSDDEWAKAIIIHLTGRPHDPTSMLLQMIASGPPADPTKENANAV